MEIKEKIAEKLAGIDCKEKIKDALDEHKDDLVKALYLDTNLYSCFLLRSYGACAVKRCKASTPTLSPLRPSMVALT